MLRPDLKLRRPAIDLFLDHAACYQADVGTDRARRDPFISGSGTFHLLDAMEEPHQFQFTHIGESAFPKILQNLVQEQQPAGVLAGKQVLF